jgi:quinol monooxygenase YgiN
MKRKNIKMKINKAGVPFKSFIVAILIFVGIDGPFAQEKIPLPNVQIVRLANLVIDSTQLENYKAALKEEIEASVHLEPGVLTLYAVSEKNNPTHITILEIYAGTAAYKAHLQTPHFIKYKTSTGNMVKSLELIETIPLIPGMKIN